MYITCSNIVSWWLGTKIVKKDRHVEDLLGFSVEDSEVINYTRC